MSMIAIMVGMPLPVINLLATLLFYLGNRRASLFVRWHCMQALLSQLTIFAMNSIAFTWTMRILFGNLVPTDQYFAYLFTIALFNIIEMVTTVIAASRVRNGKHVSWWFWGPLTHLVMGTKTN